MRIECFICGLFQTNMYVVSDECGHAMLIDPCCASAYEQQTLLRYLELNHLTLASIVATHGHLDHLWGAAWASRQFGMPVLMHEADIPFAQDMQRQYDLFGIRHLAESFPIEPLNLQLPLFTFQLLHTPGHTPGSVCLYNSDEKVLFSGDTLFRMGYGRTDLPGGDYMQLINSLRRLSTLPPDTRVYAGHGEATTIGAEAL